MSLLIRGGLVVTMNAQREVLEGGFVQIADDGSIEKVGPANELPDDHRGLVIDASGMVVLPGLIDACHVHSQNLLMGTRPTQGPPTPGEQREFAQAHFDAPILADAARVSAQSLLLGATTCVMNLMPSARADLVNATVQAMRRAGIRQIQALPYAAQAAAEVQSQQPGYDFEPDGMTHLAVEISTSADALHSGIATEAAMAAAYRVAKEQQMRVVTRTTSSEGVSASRSEQALRALGRSEILHLMELGLLDERWILIGAEALKPADLSLLLESGCAVVCTPMASAQRGHSPGPWPELLRSDVRCALGTDASAHAPMTDLLELMKSCMLTNNAARLDATAISSERVLEMATINAAKALGIDSLVGSLEPGKRADIAVVDLRGVHTQVAHKPISLLVSCAGARDVAWVLVDGRVVVRDGQMTGDGNAEAALNNCIRQARLFRPMWEAAIADTANTADMAEAG